MSDISQFLKDMKKEFGDNAVFTLKDTPLQEIDIISTGSLSLDIALGIGGIPRGRLTELYGSDGVGKTTLCFHLIVEAQKLGLEVLFVDMENAVDIRYAEAIGVDLTKIYWNQPSDSTEALGVIEAAIKSNSFGLIILDSVAALAPVKEQEDDLASANVALTPRDLTKFFRRNNHLIRENNVALLFTNQVRDKIGSYFGGLSTPGGHSLKHSRSVALSQRRVSDVKDGKEIIGFTAEIDVKKNKLAAPFKSASFDIIYGKGIDPYRDMIEVAKNLGILTLKGSYYVYIDESLGQGKDNAAETIKNNETLYNEIRKACFDKLN